MTNDTGEHKDPIQNNQKPVINTTTPVAYKPNSIDINSTNNEEDLNTYKPSTAINTSYIPNNSESKIKSTISDRFYNNLGIKPNTIISK